MEADDDDLDMLDVPESSSARGILASTRNDLRPVPRPMHPLLSSTSNRSVIPNGFQDPHGLAAPISDDEMNTTPSRALKDPSRDSSVLAREVRSYLNIEPSSVGPPDRLDQFLDDLDMGKDKTLPTYHATKPTGYCYDVRMRYHCELEPPEDRRDYHPEDPRRIFAIYRELCVAGLIEDKQLNAAAPLVPNPLQQISVREVKEEEVTLVHDKHHFDVMRRTTSQSPIFTSFLHVTTDVVR